MMRAVSEVVVRIAVRAASGKAPIQTVLSGVPVVKYVGNAPLRLLQHLLCRQGALCQAPATRSSSIRPRRALTTGAKRMMRECFPCGLGIPSRTQPSVHRSASTITIAPRSTFMVQRTPTMEIVIYTLRATLRALFPMGGTGMLALATGRFRPWHLGLATMSRSSHRGKTVTESRIVFLVRNTSERQHTLLPQTGDPTFRIFSKACRTGGPSRSYKGPVRHRQLCEGRRHYRPQSWSRRLYVTCYLPCMSLSVVRCLGSNLLYLNECDRPSLRPSFVFGLCIHRSVTRCHESVS